MRNFIVMVHKDKDSAYGLTFPDLPGCTAAAGTRAAIPAAATEALDLWFEDMPDVAPAPLEEIRQRGDVAAELAAGASLLVLAYITAKTYQAENHGC